MNSIKQAKEIFNRAIKDYHITDYVDAPEQNPFTSGDIEFLLYKKCWIDTVQWHLEDIIREPSISPVEALKIKRRIDASNQERTDMVEYIDSWFYELYKTVSPQSTISLNTESPAWAIDRYSILQLKIYHMQDQVDRTDADKDHIANCTKKLQTLQEQDTDLSTAIEQLMSDYKNGVKTMKVYKQMKMYNDPNLNPVLYKK